MKQACTQTRPKSTMLRRMAMASALLFTAGSSFAQTTLISPTGDGGFETGATFAANGWTVENYTATNTNKWFVGAVAVPSAGSNSVYISDNATGTTYNYTGSSSRVLFWRDVTFPAGETAITLSFKIKVVGEVDYDDLSVFIQNSATVPATGTQPSSSSTSAPTITGTTRLANVSDVGSSYVTRTYTISAADAGNTATATTRRLIFYWENDVSTVALPPASIDEISLVSAIPPPPPANNDAAGAVALTVNAGYNCGTTTIGTTISATASTEAVPGCNATGINDDVWYSFVATGTAHRVSFSNISAGTMVAALYTGTPGSLSFVTGACASTSLDATGLTAGTTYYVRAYTSVATATTMANFTICTGTPPPPPANDDVAGAIALTVNPDYACGSTTTGTTQSATASAEAAPSCNVTGINDDVWYSFVATNAVHRISFSNVTTGTMVAALYSGTPGSLTQVTGACASTTLNTTGLIPGTTYYVRAYTSVATVTTVTGFTICLGTVPPPPVNDNCAGAIAFPTIPTTGTCVSVTANTQSATQSLAGCAGTADDDVWFSFVCPAGYSALLFENTSVSGNSDRVIEFFSGSCGSLTSLLCSDPEDGILSGLTPGQTYYARVYTYSSANITEVSVCLKTPPIMTYVSSNTTQSSSSTLVAGSVNQQIIRTVVVTNGIANPLSATQLDYTTIASNNPGLDITSAKVYYTGTSTTFSTTTPFGTAVASPNGSFTVTGAQALSGGLSNTNNYFWLVYDINCSANPTDSVDAQCSGLVIGGNAQTPTTTSPAGSRTITALYATARSDGNSTTAVNAGAENATFTYANVTGSATCPGTATTVNFTVAGTAPAADISLAKCYYTTSTTFSNAVPFGTAIANPAAGTISFSGTQALATGSNYFWLVYDISCNATGSNTLNGDVASVVVNSTTITPTGTATAANAINALVSTMQPSTSSAVAGSLNNQILRVNINPCGASSNITSATFATTGTTNAADIISAKVYYTTSTTFATTTPFGAPVANPNGSFTVTGSQNMTGTGYLWLVYDLNCAATVANVIDAACSSVTVSGASYTPATANPTGTRAVSAAVYSASVTQASTTIVPQGSNGQQIIYATLSGCVNTPVTSITFGTTGTTNTADIAAARVYYTTTSTFSNAVPFGSTIASPGAAMTFTGSQSLTTGTGYFWLVYDIATTATVTNVVDASLTSSVINGITTTPTTGVATGNRTITTPLVNDNAPGALTIALGAGCSAATNTNVNASQDGNEPHANCSAALSYATVWYKFVAPASGAVRISTDLGTGNTLSDSRVGLFSATNVNDYSTFSIIACDEDGGNALGSGYMSVLYATGLTSGTTYYIQVGNFASTTVSGTFCLAVDELGTGMLATANTCASSYQAPTGTYPSYTGWLPLMDAGSKLIALVRNSSGVSGSSYTVAQNINAGALRADANGLKYLDRNFRITNSNTGTYEVQLFLLSTEQAALQAADPAATLSGLNITRVTGETGCSNNATGSGTTSLITQSGSGSAGGVSWVSFSTPGFSNFFLNSGAIPLPVVLKNFSGKNAGMVNNLNWETTAEKNFSHFELQRSADGIRFSNISRIEADRNTTGSNYAYTDAAPFEGINIYRLNMVDLDGKSSVSRALTLMVKTGNGISVQVYPNPVQQELQISIAGKTDGQGRIQVLDLTGKVVTTTMLQGNTARIAMAHLPAGMYLVKYTDNSHTSVIKITKEQ